MDPATEAGPDNDGVPMPITLALDGVLNRGAPLDAAMAAMLAAAGY